MKGELGQREGDHLLEVRNLRTHFPVRGGLLRRVQGWVKAVDGVSFAMGERETLGLVGESGCGKSTLAKTLVRLWQPRSGEIFFRRQALGGLSARQMRPLRRGLQMVFQDPAESLDARLSVEELIAEPLVIHGVGRRAERQERVAELLDQVGLPRRAAQRFPFEFSGGQRQRIGIARALALNPDLLILDEPVSALDVSVQSQILNLLLDLQREQNLAYLFIAHDLAVVNHVSDRIAVMYLGRIVELGPAEALYGNPRHAYTKALFSAVPTPDPRVAAPEVVVPGEIPSPLHPPPGCAFGHRVQHPRYGESVGMELELREVSPGHFVQNCPCCVEGD